VTAKTGRKKTGRYAKLTADDVRYIQAVCEARRYIRRSFLKVDELARQFNVSEMTIRRALELDVAELETRRVRDEEKRRRYGNEQRANG
jgi:hypothetical protein